jgi:hypothetical protein
MSTGVYRDGVDPRAVKYQVIHFIRQHEGATAREVALHFAGLFRPSRLYGAHRNISTLIAELRAAGILEDVPRCPHCQRALTRGRANGPLRVRQVASLGDNL